MAPHIAARLQAAGTGELLLEESVRHDERADRGAQIAVASFDRGGDARLERGLLPAIRVPPSRIHRSRSVRGADKLLSGHDFFTRGGSASGIHALVRLPSSVLILFV